MDMPCWNASRWSGSPGQGDVSSTPHPVSHLARLPAACLSPCCWQRTPQTKPSDRPERHSMRRSKVNTNVACWENLLSLVSAQKSPLTSAHAGLGQGSVLSTPVLADRGPGHPCRPGSVVYGCQHGDSNVGIGVGCKTHPSIYLPLTPGMFGSLYWVRKCPGHTARPACLKPAWVNPRRQR